MEVLRERYVASEKQAQSRTLDELVQIAGYHRKYALRLLRKNMPSPAYEAHGRPRTCDDAVKGALIVLWEASDRICGKRLKAVLAELLRFPETHEHLKLDAQVRELVPAVSAASIDRLLKNIRSKMNGRSRRRPMRKVRSQILVKTFAGWGECGVRSSGNRFRRTLWRNAGWFLHSQFCDYGRRNQLWHHWHRPVE